MEQSYPRVLQRKLNERASACHFEVINYSMPGLSLRQKVHLVERYACDYHLDLIIVDYCVNDVMPDYLTTLGKDTESWCNLRVLGIKVPCALESRMRKSVFLFALKKAVEQGMLRMGWADRSGTFYMVEGDYYQRLYQQENAPEILASTFNRIREYQDTHGVTVSVPIFPMLYDLDHYNWRELDRQVAVACESQELAHTSLLDAFAACSHHHLRVQRGDSLHPAIAGNEIAGTAILASLTKADLLPSDALH
jgi:hypothetical protein